MAGHNTPRHATGLRPEATLNPVEVRISGGMLALNRFLMTLQNKRMPVASFTVGREGDSEAMRATILLDCPPEAARRYTALLSALEDVQEAEAAAETMEVALLKVGGEAWREAATRAGIVAHEENGTVVASGATREMAAWLAGIREDVEDVVRLGPVARPTGEA